MVDVGANGDSKSIIQIRRLAKNYLRGNEELHVPPIRLRSVVLPEPLGPMKATKSP